uniref:Uncharacterized protein n=1 Tax=Pseudomonas phage RVTF4 TaxID=3236931 RepID=A0AB39CCR4_9VIRU
MVIDIPTNAERIAHKYERELEVVSGGLNNAIKNDTLQSNYKDHRWVSFYLHGDNRQLDISDEFFDHISKLYLKAGWFLERRYGEETTEDEGKLIAIDCFVASKSSVDAANAE